MGEGQKGEAQKEGETRERSQQDESSGVRGVCGVVTANQSQPKHDYLVLHLHDCEGLTEPRSA